MFVPVSLHAVEAKFKMGLHRKYCKFIITDDRIGSFLYVCQITLHVSCIYLLVDSFKKKNIAECVGGKREIMQMTDTKFYLKRCQQD